MEYYSGMHQQRAPETLATLVNWCGERYRNGSLGIASSFIPMIQRSSQQEQQVFSPKSFLSHRHLAYSTLLPQVPQQPVPQPIAPTKEEEETVDFSNTNLLLLDQFLKRAEEEEVVHVVDTSITMQPTNAAAAKNNKEEEEVEYIIEETCTIESFEDVGFPYFNPDGLCTSKQTESENQSSLRDSYEGPGETNKKRKRTDVDTGKSGFSVKRVATKGGEEEYIDYEMSKLFDEHFPPMATTKASFSRCRRSFSSSSFCQVTQSNDPMENYIAQLLSLDNIPLDGSAFDSEWYSTTAF